eukprot:CAMPEP_0204581194 /NCGR_PEP_ID=MMETSP0661-20131031/44499_1 /ASSEMBLY_ACC=CAM_ASM_000606 /TAXON_ID=109239 /ORGANISM="Alexandrium margalefi, Strain AMGDE01CS-322" /LENGTH=31 /DNA_ID= /DNA_START= /DNA_END= /DNA_ORIENTATION=
MASSAWGLRGSGTEKTEWMLLVVLKRSASPM